MRIALLGLNQKTLYLTETIFFLVFAFTAFAQGADKSEKVKNQIQVLNLLNGLELDNEQMQTVLGAACRAEDARIEAKERISRQEEQISLVYNEVLRLVKAGSQVMPKDTALKVHKSNQAVDGIKQGLGKEISALAIKIKDTLEPHQLYVLDDYKPCIIPALKQGRIGQVDDPGGFTKALERVYSLPQDRYDFQKPRIAQRAIDGVKAKAPSGFIIDEAELRQQLFQTMDDVRGMGSLDFAVKKEEIAGSIKAKLFPKKPPVNIGVKIEHFLLSSEIIPILEERLSVQ